MNPACINLYNDCADLQHVLGPLRAFFSKFFSPRCLPRDKNRSSIARLNHLQARNARWSAVNTIVRGRCRRPTSGNSRRQDIRTESR
jgi:hypothetical protein